ncbi:hypothetical protein wcw_1349 [Waddlia chondrophila WSU 86-1044]|uniref:Uncharacterized protein n=1 Tax=Waddlia chondrophila (strain ATCC VR-1470 / WSU 86-1044) TaxID=716544 RepID=D6YRK5_WADCW|nr:hypothetical protein wcw_1349 [Waddlia chondrophila WSU 86-1044]
MNLNLKFSPIATSEQGLLPCLAGNLNFREIDSV